MPHILVAAALISILGASYASVIGSTSSSRAVWMVSPLTITFSGSGGTSSSGSVGDPFKCAPSTTDVSLRTRVSSPKISLTTDQTNFPSCGPPFNPVTITARCLVAAPDCRGTYTGTVTIFQPYGYATILPDLSVTIKVT